MCQIFISAIWFTADNTNTIFLLCLKVLFCLKAMSAMLLQGTLVSPHITKFRSYLVHRVNCIIAQPLIGCHDTASRIVAQKVEYFQLQATRRWTRLRMVSVGCVASIALPQESLRVIVSLH